MKPLKDKDKIESEFIGDIEDIVKIDLSNIGGGDEMLKYLFLIITYQPENNIKHLILRNNDIKDPSMLNKINFNKLTKLDLGDNKIEDLNFLQNMKSENLKDLYLDNNLFKVIYPILNAHFPSLQFLSLNGNKLNYDNIEKNPGYIELKNKQIRNGERLMIQLYSKKNPNKKSEKLVKEFKKDDIEIKDGELELKEPLNKKSLILKNQSIPNDEFLCPECSQLTPEISNINVYNKKIEFRSKIFGEREYYSENFDKKINLKYNIIFYYFKR